MAAKIRKIVVTVDETRIEMGRQINPPTRRAVAVAVIENPYAGKYVESLDDLIAAGEELGGLLGEKCVQALGIQPGQAESYGKAAPRANEIVVAVAVTDSGRPLPRVGGLTKDEIKGEDGLR